MALLFFILAGMCAYCVRKKWWAGAVFSGLSAIYFSQLQIMALLRAIFIDGTLNR